MTSSLPRTAAGLAGLAYLALGVTTLVIDPVPDQHWGTSGTVVDVLGLVGFAATVPAAELLRAPLRLRGIGLVALRAAQVGLTAMSVESVASAVHQGNTLSWLFLGGLVVTLLGLLVVAVVGLVRSSARWVAPLPFLGLLVGIGAGEHGGFLVPGVVWVVLATASLGAPARETVPV